MRTRCPPNVPLSGPIALGNAFVTASDCRIVSDDRYTVRFALMNTTTLHPLDGRALWVLVYDRSAATTTFFAVGAGRNSLPFLDRMNNHTAGLVFSGMHRSFAKALEVAGAGGGITLLTDGVRDFALSHELLLAEGDKALGARRGMAATFDLFSRLIALVRQNVGMDVIDVPPSAENGEQSVLSLHVPRDQDRSPTRHEAE